MANDNSNAQDNNNNIITNPYANDQQYYENPENWGNAQYITLADIINTIKLTSGDDSYLRNIETHVLSIYGKQAIKKLNIALKLGFKALNLTVPESKIIPFPRYMTNWARVSVINSCGKLEELNINNSYKIKDYLQDHKGNLLFDHFGDVLEANEFNADKGFCMIRCDNCIDNCGDDFSESWVKAVDKRYFEFSDDLVGRDVVIEYQTAGLDTIKDCDLQISSNLEFAITEYIKWRALEGNRNIPQGQVMYHYELWKQEKRNAKILEAPKISIKQIIEAVERRY